MSEAAEEQQSQCCPQCGAVGTKRWKREDGLEVCDECWLECGPPARPKLPRTRFSRRRRIVRKERDR
jgi:hypothetical protein